MSTEIIEGLKEVLRTAIMAVIPIVVSQLQSGKIEGTAILVAGAIALLSGLDKWLHKSDLSLIPIKGSTGLTGV